VTDQTLPEAPKPQASIQQLNLGYNLEQDRMLLRVGMSDDSELVLWLTYRITRQLWQLLNEDACIPTATSINSEAMPADAVEQFNKEAEAAEALKKMDFSTQYQPRKEKRNEEVLLVTALKMTGDHIKHLEVICLKNVTVNVSLGKELILGTCQMLQVAAKQAGWDLGATLAIMPVPKIEETKVLH
jgi:hypothetical protein